jgi:multiple antibiotic resistance protein
VDPKFFGEVFVTLVVIMDPPGAIPVFLAVTSSLSRAERHHAATVAVGTALVVIALFALGGQAILNYLNITVPAIQVSGGLLLLLVALQLLTGTGMSAPELAETHPEQRANIAMVPLGTPLLAGPGAIAATIVFVQRVDGARDGLAVALGIVAVHGVLWLTLRFAGVIRRIIKDTGVLLVSRVAGLLTAAIAVQLVADGVTAFVKAA